MNPEDFKQQAMATISDNPLDRISAKVTQMMTHPDTVFDIHCHIFDKYCVTKNYFLLRLLGKLDPDKKLDDLLDHIINLKKDNEFDELFEIMQLENMEQVLDHYLQNFACQQNIVPVPLMMDLDEGWYFKAEKSQKDQIKELKDLMQNKAIMPFLSVDPRKAQKRGNNNLYKLFLDAFTPDANNNQFFGIKVYPALGYLPSDPWLWHIYEVCEEKQIPVVTHCGGTIIKSYQNNYFAEGHQIHDNGEIVTLNQPINIPNGKDRAIFFNDPKHWEVVLKKFPKLKLNLGHFGGADHWKNLDKTDRDETIETINHLMAYDNVYADFSYCVTDKDTFKVFFKNYDNNYTIRNKAMYGTDCWMVLAAGDFKKNHAKFIQRCGPRKNKLMRENPMMYLFGQII